MIKETKKNLLTEEFLGYHRQPRVQPSSLREMMNHAPTTQPREVQQTCPQKECLGRVIRRKRKGRFVRYRNLSALPIPSDLSVPTCNQCGCFYLDRTVKDKLGEVYRDELRARAREAIDTLSGYISQRELERQLYLSQGYLSRIRSGAGNPSAELVSNLRSLARDPVNRLEELKKDWEVSIFSSP